MQEKFSATVRGGVLSGWVAGQGEPVLALHGGPGLTFTYMDEAVADLVGQFRVASFQQRGLAPSVEAGPFTIKQALDDVAAVLDHLSWDRAYLLGHSWGGHLAFHAAVALAPRLLGVLAVDPLGAVGDGGSAAFEAELYARIPETARQRVKAIEELENEGQMTEAEALESLQLVWPGYFADPKHAPPMPPMPLSLPAQALFGEVVSALPGLEASLPGVTVPVGVLTGASSPIPEQEAGIVTAAHIPGAWTVSIPQAGHFPWIEAPGCVAAAMKRLTSHHSQT